MGRASTPLKVLSNGDLRAFTEEEERYLAYAAGVHVSLLDSDQAGGITREQDGVNNLSLGPFIDSKYDQAVGAHVNLSSSTSQYPYWIKAGTLDKTSESFRNLISWDYSLNAIKEMNNNDLTVLGRRLSKTIAQNEYPGSYRIGSSSPGSDWTIYKQNAFTDTRTDGTATNYNIYIRTTGQTSNPHSGRVLPSALKRSSGGSGTYQGFERFSDQQLSYTLGEKVKELIAGGDIGTVLLRSTADGAPSSGTWVARGYATDTRQEVGDTDFVSTSTPTYVGNFQAEYLGDFQAEYALEVTYVTTSSGIITREYSGDYTGNFAGDYTTEFLGSQGYTNDFVSSSEISYTNVFVADFVGSAVKEKNVTESYTGDFLADFIGDYLGSTNRTSDYTGDFSGQFTGNYLGDFLSSTTFARTRTQTALENYTGDFLGNYTGSINYLGSNSVSYIADYVKVYIGDFLSSANFTSTRVTYAENEVIEEYTGDFIGDYIGSINVLKDNSVGYIADYIGDYIGDFIGSLNVQRDTSVTDESVMSSANITVPSANYLNYVGDYIGSVDDHPYTITYIGDFLTSTDYTNTTQHVTSVNYIGAGSTQDDGTKGYIGDFIGDYIGPDNKYHIKTFVEGYLNYVGDYIGSVGKSYIGTPSTDYANYIGDPYVANFVGQTTYTGTSYTVLSPQIIGVGAQVNGTGWGDGSTYINSQTAQSSISVPIQLQIAISGTTSPVAGVPGNTYKCTFNSSASSGVTVLGMTPNSNISPNRFNTLDSWTINGNQSVYFPQANSIYTFPGISYVNVNIILNSEGSGKLVLNVTNSTGSTIYRKSQLNTNGTAPSVYSTQNYTPDFQADLTYTPNYLGTSQINYLNDFVEGYVPYHSPFLGSAVDYSEQGPYAHAYTPDYITGYTGSTSVDYLGSLTVQTNNSVTYTSDYQVNYLGDYTGQVEYTGDFVANYTEPFIHNYIGDFITSTSYESIAEENYIRYANPYIFTYVGDFLTSTEYSITRVTIDYEPYTGDFLGDYTGSVTRNTSTSVNYQNYLEPYIVNYVGDFLSSTTFTSTKIPDAFVGDYLGDFVGDYTGSIQYVGTALEDYAAEYLNTFVADYISSAEQQKNRTSTTTDGFTGDYIGGFLGSVNSTVSVSKSFAGTYTGNYTSDYVSSAQYTETYTTDSTDNFVTAYTGDFGAAYTGDYTGSLIYTTLYTSESTEDYASTSTASYTGEFAATTILQTNEVVETYTLYVRVE